MPIYEFRCNNCHKRLTVFQRNINAPATAVCPNCGGSDLRRLVSRFAVVRNEDQMLDSLDDDSLLSGVDENDPRSVAAWARKMQSKMGEDIDPQFDEMIDRMEAGESPDDLDSAISGGGGDDDFDL
jgi:putative FmdB family regulatory protein